jgi:putative resolvase
LRTRIGWCDSASLGSSVSAPSTGPSWLVLNNEQLSPEQEMVQDLLTIVHCFSAHRYGLRNYRKKLNEALKEDIK